MADDDYDTKLESLRRYIPFLVNMMAELKAKGNREAQLTKIMSLHDMITDTRKKLKLETLNRCEEVLTNIYYKVNPQLKNKGQPLGESPKESSNLPGIEGPRSTPASPSPPRDVILTTPVTIPTEKISTTSTGISSESSKKSHLPKVDVYSNVVINNPSTVNTPMIAAKVPDMSKPPISLDDLKNLEDDVQQKISDAKFANASVDDLQAYRKELELQLRIVSVTSAMSPEKSRTETINTTVRNTPHLSNKLAFSESKLKRQESPKGSINSNNPVKEIKNSTPDKVYVKEKDDTNASKASKDPIQNKSPQKVLKDSTSTFGSLLSSIDNKLLEDKKKSKKSDRRSSITSNKEDNGSTTSFSSDKSDNKETEAKARKDKDSARELKDKRSGESHRHRRSSIEKERHKHKKREENKDKDRSARKEKSKSKEHGHQDKSSSSSVKSDDKSLTTPQDKALEKKIDMFLSDILLSRSKAFAEQNMNLSKTVSPDSKDVSTSNKKSASNESTNSPIAMSETSNSKKSDISTPSTVASKETQSQVSPELPKPFPVFKRLADKYNPKPKLKTTEIESSDVDKAVSDSIEQLMKVSPPKPLSSPLGEPKKLLGEPKNLLGERALDPTPSQLNPPGLLTEQTKPVQLPDILQKIFSKPLLGELIPKRLNENIFPLTAQNRTQNLQMTKPGGAQPLEPPILSPPHRPLHFQPPDMPMNFQNFASPPIRQDVLPSHDMSTRHGALPTPGSQLGMIPAPPIPPSLPRGFTDHNSLMDMGYGTPLGTPRVDFDTPSTPMPDFDSPRVDFEPPSHLGNDQFNVNQGFIPPMHQERPMHGFDPRNQNFMGQPQFPLQPEMNIYNNHLGHGMGYYGPSNHRPLLSPDAPLYISEPNFYQERAWNENQRWGRDRRPGDPRNYREYKEMRERQEREARAAQEKQKEIKDPRLAPRDFNNISGEKDVRDPRLFREGADRGIGDKSESIVRDPRLSRARGKSVDRQRDPNKSMERDNEDSRTPGEDTRIRAKSRDRDPKDRARSRERALSRLRDSSDFIDSRSRPRERESRFDRMYSKTNRPRSRSRSRPREEKNEEDESFLSPLDSLYNAGEKGRTGRGYGVQKFKIPRKSRIDDIKRKDERKNEKRRSVTKKKRYFELSDDSDESDRNDVDNNSIPETDSDIEFIEDNKSEEVKETKIKSQEQASENVKDEKESSKKSDELVDTSRIKVIIKAVEEVSNENEIWLSNSENEDFISEYDREYQLENRDKGPDVAVSHEEEKHKESLENEMANIKTKESDLQIEEPSSSQDVSEKLDTNIEKSTKKPKAADSSKEQDDASTSKKISEENIGDSLNKQAECVEADSSKKSDGALTPQESCTKSDEPSEQNILAHFFENLLKSRNKKDKKTALFSLIETFSDSFDTRQIQKIRKIINVNEDIEEESDEEEKETKSTTQNQISDTKSEIEISNATKAPVQEEQPEVGSTTEEIPPNRDTILDTNEINVSEEPLTIDQTQVDEVTKSDDSLNQINESELIENLEPVMVSVGERIKNRKRTTNTPKPRKKGKTELDLLHEDIQDMFIRDGVLTATGKRMCRILKDDPTALSVTKPDIPSEQPKKVRKKPGPKPKPKINTGDAQNSMKDMRVVIKKMPDNVTSTFTNSPNTRQLRNRNRLSSYAESDDDSQRDNNDSSATPQLRNRNLRTSYAESDNDSQKSLNESYSTFLEDNESLRSEVEGELSSESEEEDNKSHSSDGVPKPRAARRRRAPKWASGIIPKFRKKKPQSKSQENSPAQSRASSPDPSTTSLMDYDFDKLVEPDKNYYYDYTNKAKIKCKLCKYSGHLLTGHYLKEHPQSEVLCSRLAPPVASEAIRDYSVNGKKYESVTTMKLTTKYHYSCRVCGFTSTTSPIFFYEHVTTHTGEYRHQCGICEYYAVTGKTMAFHFQSVHPNQEKKSIKRTYTLANIFGYICGECNFLQLKEKSVEDHANIFHLGERPTIYKINMSTVIDPVLDIESPKEIKSLEPKLTGNSEVFPEIEVLGTKTTENESAVPIPLPATKVRKKPGPKPKLLIKQIGIEDENKDEENPAPITRKKPGPKSKTLPSAEVTEHPVTETVTEERTSVPVKKKPGPKSKTQKVLPPVFKEPSIDNESTNEPQQKQTTSTQEEVTPSPRPVEDPIKEVPTRKRRRSLDKLIPEDSRDDLDTIITLSSRSSRAAKDKATAKLKTLMESNEGLSTRKKPDTDSARKEKDADMKKSQVNEGVNKKDNQQERAANNYQGDKRNNYQSGAENNLEGEAEKNLQGDSVSNEQIETESIHQDEAENVLINDTRVEKDKPEGHKDVTNELSINISSEKKDLNVFTCKTDIVEEDAKKIEEDRLRKMEELNKSIGSRTSKLDFVDKLSNRLSNQQSSQDPKVRIKQEPTDDYIGFTAEPSRSDTPTMPVLEKELPLSLPLTKTPPLVKVNKSPVISKKPVLEDDNQLHQSSINFRQNKPNSLFSNMIEKLQGKVNEAAVQQECPSTSAQNTSEENLSNVERPKSPEILISIGDLITVIKKDNEIMYSCRANNCYVVTKDKMVFQLHCKFGHKDLTITSSLCEKCGVVVEITPDTSLLENLYDHLVFAHFDCISKPTSLRMRRLSGDKLSVKQEASEHIAIKRAAPEKELQDFESRLDLHVLSKLPSESTPHTVTSPVSTETELASASTEASLEHAATPMETGPVPEVSLSKTIHTDVEMTSEEPVASEATLELAEDNPFSFKIANVISLAESTGSEDQAIQSPPSQKKLNSQELPLLKPVPPLTLISVAKQQPSVQQNQLIVKEAKLTAAELTRPKKAPKALQKFIDTPGELYKCPHFYCMFSTNVRTFLERHLKAHKSDSEAMVPCVYCDMKTPWEHVPMHIDIRHANCRFVCTYCLYRAYLKEYVCLHQELAHPNKDYIILSLRQRSNKKFSVADMKIDYRTLCEPFSCSCIASKVEYLFETEFASHLVKFHHNKHVVCGYPRCRVRINSSMMINHWASCHGICTYQCAYCKTSGRELTGMYTHFAQFHPSISVDILVRMTDSLPKDRELGYSNEAFERLGHIKKMPQNLLTSIGRRGQRTIKLLQFNSAPGSSEEPTTSMPETILPGTSSVKPLLTLSNLQQGQAVPVCQSQQPKIIISNPNVQLLVASTSEKLYLVPASMVSPTGQSVMSTAPISKVVAQTSTASNTLSSKADESILAEAASALPKKTIEAISSSNIVQESMKIGEVAIRPIGKSAESSFSTTSSSHSTIAVLSRSLPTTVSSSSSRTQRSVLKSTGSRTSNADSGIINENRNRTGSPSIQIGGKTGSEKVTTTIKPIQTPSELLRSSTDKPTSEDIAFIEPFSEEASSQDGSTGLSEDDILQSAIQSILDGDELSGQSAISEIFNTEPESGSTITASSSNFTNTRLLDTTANNETAPKTNQEVILSAVRGSASTISQSSTPVSTPVSKTVPPPLVLISESPKTDKRFSELITLTPSSQLKDCPTTLNTFIDTQELNENISTQVAPVEHVEVAGNIPESTLLAEEVDPLNIDTLESNEDSNSGAPLFDDINVGIDSPPEDPLTITPTFNSDLPSADDPLNIDDSSIAADMLEFGEVDSIKEADSINQSLTESIPDPLKITRRSMSMVSNSDDESDSSSSDKGKKRGLIGYQLFRCISCNMSFSNVQSFKSHISNSIRCKKVGPRQYQCVHCEKTLKTPQRLADHIQTHGVARFACSLCNEKYPTVGIAKLHMKNRHNIQQSNLVPLKSDRSNMDIDQFTIKPCQANQPTNKDKESSSESPKQAVDESTYNPDQIDSIPIRQIFSTNVKCGKCSYQTKVRVNIVRHLQMHLEEKAVPDTAPVNPVPCLEKNEKMFDKMINLAASSITTGRMGGPNQDKEKEEEKHPEFIPSHRRFVCSAQGCSYLCPEEANLKHHLMALHSDDLVFTCAHCKTKIEPTDPDSVIKHFKLHGLHLYKCHYCSFVHHLKHKVEKHITDGHLDAVVKVVTIRNMESEPQEFGSTEETPTPQPSTSTKFKPWRCCMCKVKCHTKEDIKSHIQHRHNIDTQHKCTLCAFKNDNENSFKEHFKEKHPNHEIDLIFVYQKVEEEVSKDDTNVTPFDTTPLWQRDKPRVRHIRGILFDEVSPQPTKSPKKPPKSVATTSPKVSVSTSSIPTSTASKNLFDCIDAVARGTAETLWERPKVSSNIEKVVQQNVKTYSRSDIVSGETASSSSTSISAAVEKEEIAAVSCETTEDKDVAADSDSANDDVIEIKQTTNVIVIDSDESDTEQKLEPKIDDMPKSKDKDSKLKPVSKNRTQKRPGTTDLLQEAVKMAKIEETDDDDSIMASNCSKEHLISMYGAFGTPHNKQWKCPKCHKFKSKRVGDFMFHIYKDFNIFRYKCKACSDLSITHKYMLDHVKLHPGFTEDIIEPLAPNVKLDTWIHMVIREQSLVILKNSPLMKKRPLTGPTDITCYFCNEKFMSMPDCCEHMLYHWVMMPYQCQDCRSEFYTVYDLKHHHKIEHPDQKLYLDPKGPTLAKAVQCIENLKKRPNTKSSPDSPSRKKAKIDDTAKELKLGNEEITSGIVINPPKFRRGPKVAPTTPNSSTDVIKIDDDDDDLVIISKTDDKVPNEDEVFACDACAYMADTEVLIAKHSLDTHGIKTRKYHILSKKKSEIPSLQDMACNICDSVFSELKLRRHFLDTHLETHIFSPYRFKCEICLKRYLTLPKVKMHFNRCHTGMVMRYQCAVQSATHASSKSRLYTCTMCSYTNISNNSAALRQHIRGHLRPIVCNHCNVRFRYHGEAHTHSIKEHPELEEDITILEDIQREFSETLKEITQRATPVNEIGIITRTPPVTHVRNFAKKSTSAKFTASPICPDEEKEYSYYGIPSKEINLTNIVTTFELDGLEYTTTAEQMMKMFNMDTFVDVSDSAVDIIPLDKS